MRRCGQLEQLLTAGPLLQLRSVTGNGANPAAAASSRAVDGKGPERAGLNNGGRSSSGGQGGGGGGGGPPAPKTPRAGPRSAAPPPKVPPADAAAAVATKSKMTVPVAAPDRRRSKGGGAGSNGAAAPTPVPDDEPGGGVGGGGGSPPVALFIGGTVAAGAALLVAVATSGDKISEVAGDELASRSSTATVAGVNRLEHCMLPCMLHAESRVTCSRCVCCSICCFNDLFAWLSAMQRCVTLGECVSAASSASTCPVALAWPCLRSMRVAPSCRSL